MRASWSAGCQSGYTQGGAGGGGEGGAGGGAHVTPEVSGEISELYREQCQLTPYSQDQGKQSGAQREDCWKSFNKIAYFITQKNHSFVMFVLIARGSPFPGFRNGVKWRPIDKDCIPELAEHRKTHIFHKKIHS